ncbi:hypothetical protein [Microbacterium sp.]|uniref:hypothetical protein n=1 Tax=Microbacterium sp. TaxID=51671 RepID=UPI0026182F85|nr:hypothetical protein [Microbacterium sp.]
MRRLRTVCAAATMAAVAFSAFAAAPALAADDETGFADDDYNGFREVVGEGDDAYWSVTIRRDGAYIATWERDPSDGVWESPEQAIEAINEVYTCLGDVQLEFVSQFANHDQFAAHPSTHRDVNDDGTYTWSFTEGSAEAEAMSACSAENPWTTEFVTIIETDDPAVNEIQIPVSTLGPGVHKLFIQDLTRQAEGQHDYPNGAWVGYTSGYDARGEADWITISVPEPTSKEFPYVTVVAPGALTDPSALAQSVPPYLEADTPAITGAALPAAGAALGLTALIGVPMVLFARRKRRADAPRIAGGAHE